MQALKVRSYTTPNNICAAHPARQHTAIHTAICATLHGPDCCLCSKSQDSPASPAVPLHITFERPTYLDMNLPPSRHSDTTSPKAMSHAQSTGRGRDGLPQRPMRRLEPAYAGMEFVGNDQTWRTTRVTDVEDRLRLLRMATITGLHYRNAFDGMCNTPSECTSNCCSLHCNRNPAS